MFKRKIESILQKYYGDPQAKILIVKGARQVGKSFIIRNTASRAFSNYVEVDLKADFYGQQLFLDVRTLKEFHVALSSAYGRSLHDASDTIVFLDEIQFYPNLITLLKDLWQESRFRYIASGSLLGITMKHVFIPMGAVQEQDMFPMDFEEFLWANGVGTEAIDFLRESFLSLSPLPDAIHARFLGLFRDYLVAGGLPDSVTEYVLNKNIAQMRVQQSLTYRYYMDDCSQYDAAHKLKIMRIYESMISYMSNRVKRIQFKAIEGIDKARADRYQDEFDYLLASGIAIGVQASSNPTYPLVQSSSKNLIKLYFNDVGILSDLLYKTNVMPLLRGDSAVNLGSVYETAVAMELKAHGHDLFYFDSKKTGEVDFLVNDYEGLSVLPIEVKSGSDQGNFRAIPKLVDSEGGYKLPKGYVLGNRNTMARAGNLITLPIYMAMFL